MDNQKGKRKSFSSGSQLRKLRGHAIIQTNRKQKHACKAKSACYPRAQNCETRQIHRSACAYGNNAQGTNTHDVKVTQETEASMD